MKPGIASMRRGLHMQKLLLLSVIITTFALPVAIARRRQPHEYEATLSYFAIFVAIYVVLLLFLYPRLM